MLTLSWGSLARGGGQLVRLDDLHTGGCQYFYARRRYDFYAGGRRAGGGGGERGRHYHRVITGWWGRGWGGQEANFILLVSVTKSKKYMM